MTTPHVQGERIRGTEPAEEREAIHARNLNALEERVRLIKTAKADAVANTRSLIPVAIAGNDAAPAQVVLDVPGGLGVGQDLRFQVGDVAHEQLRQLFYVDAAYYKRLLEPENAPLLAQNLAWWMTKTPADRLLRALRPEALPEVERRIMAGLGAHLRLRGVLGKGYRTIDDADLVAAIVPDIVAQGGRLTEFSIDERRLHAKFFGPGRSVQDLRREYAAKYNLTEDQVAHHAQVTVKGKKIDVSFVDEALAMGVVIRHSEVGFASLGVSFVERVCKCLNDMVEEKAVAIVHRGGKNGVAGDDDIRFLTDGTRALEDAALLSRVRDTVVEQFGEVKQIERANRVAFAKIEDVGRPAEVPLFQFVGNIGANLGLNQREVEILKEETGKSVMEEGGEKRFAFIQGLTAVAREMTDYDRRLEVEGTAFKLLNDDAELLVKLARDPGERARGGALLKKLAAA